MGILCPHEWRCQEINRLKCQLMPWTSRFTLQDGLSLPNPSAMAYFYYGIYSCRYPFLRCMVSTVYRKERFAQRNACYECFGDSLGIF